MDAEETKTSDHSVKKKTKNRRIIFTPTLVFLTTALALAIGYFAGTYHYQIEATVGPIFGYNSHTGYIDLRSLQETYNALAARYDGKLDANKLIAGANSGLVDAAGDAYTVYMSASDATSYSNNLSGNVGAGIGAEIGIKSDKVTILKALDNNAAKKVGLQANDVILNINGEPTDGWTVDEAVGKIRGEAGTTVKLTIQRVDTIKDYTITREIINNPSVTSEVSGNLGIMTITRFDSNTANLAKIAAEGFIKNNVKYVILDLRDNGGGYVEAAQGVLGLWLDDKLIATEKTSSGTILSKVTTDNSDAILSQLPTVVVVNANSASASEIVAGALKDYGAAKLVGEKTFGKGSVQELISLSGGAELKVTIAKWYTPKGKNISKEGITPDVTADLTQSDVDRGIDPQMQAAKLALGL